MVAPTSSVLGSESWRRRQKELRSGGLVGLYSSQAWSLYRVVPLYRSVVDFGFGTPESLLAVREINPTIEYLGVDVVTAVVGAAQHSYGDERTQFAALDFAEATATAELAMGWSFVYAHDRPYEAIQKLWDTCTRFALFDLRATHLGEDVTDARRSYGEHDGSRVCYPLLSWSRLIKFLMGLEPVPTIEFTTYYFPPSRCVHVDHSIPEPFVASLILSREGSGGVTGRLVPPPRV